MIKNAEKESKLIMLYFTNNKKTYIFMKNNENFNDEIINQYGSLFKGHNFNVLKIDNFLKIRVGSLATIMSLAKITNLLTDLLYFYPDLYICQNKLPIRKKDIMRLANFAGYKSHAKKLLAFYKKYDF